MFIHLYHHLFHVVKCDSVGALQNKAQLIPRLDTCMLLPLPAFHPPLVCELLNPRFAAGARHRGVVAPLFAKELICKQLPSCGRVRIFLPAPCWEQADLYL